MSLIGRFSLRTGTSKTTWKLQINGGMRPYMGMPNIYTQKGPSLGGQKLSLGSRKRNWGAYNVVILFSYQPSSERHSCVLVWIVKRINLTENNQISIDYFWKWNEVTIAWWFRLISFSMKLLNTITQIKKNGARILIAHTKCNIVAADLFYSNDKFPRELSSHIFQTLLK